MSSQCCNCFTVTRMVFEYFCKILSSSTISPSDVVVVINPLQKQNVYGRFAANELVCQKMLPQVCQFWPLVANFQQLSGSNGKFVTTGKHVHQQFATTVSAFYLKKKYKTDSKIRLSEVLAILEINIFILIMYVLLQKKKSQVQ